MLNFSPNFNSIKNFKSVNLKNNLISFSGNFSENYKNSVDEQDFYTKSDDTIRRPKDALEYLHKKLPQTNNERMFPYLANTVQMLCGEDENAENLKRIIDFISENDLSENILYSILTNGGINSKLTDDLDEIKMAGKDFIPEFKDDDEALEFAKEGDVFKTKNSDFAKIKTDNDTIKELKISPKTYLKLFPPAQRYMITQGFSGDCFLLSSLNAIFNHPKAKYNILSSFTETKDGVNVKFPNGQNELFFKNCELNEDTDDVRLSTGCTGIQMLEHLYGYETVTDRQNEGKEILELDEINDGLEDWCPKYKCIEDYYRDHNGSKVSDALYKLGYNNTKRLTLKIPFMHSMFSDALNEADKDTIIIAAPDKKRHLPNGNELEARHAYQIKPQRTDDGVKYRVINASNSAFYANMELDDILNNFDYGFVTKV